MYITNYNILYCCVSYIYVNEWQQPVYQATTVDDEVPELCCTKTVKMVANLRKTNGGTTLLSTGSVLYVFHPS